MVSAAHTFYVVGLGSMGKRRIRNLMMLGVPAQRIVGFDPRTARCSEVARTYGIRTSSDFKKGVKAFKPSALIISTPPDKHAPYMLFAARNALHFFVEVTTVDDGYRTLMPLLTKRFVAAPSCTFRYVPAIQTMRTLLQKGSIGTPLFFQHYLGQYLPDWHPYEDFRKVYFSKKKTGGAREMFPYELQWLGFLLGSRVKRASGVVTKVSRLPIHADDVYSSTVQYESGVVGSVNIDLLNRKASRTLRIVGSKGTIEWDWLARTVTVSTPGKRSNTIKFPREKKFKHYNTTENIYIAEMKDFLDAVRGKKRYPYSFAEDWAILQTMYDVEKRSKQLLKRHR
jgi:predicted dehydrogenase